MPRILLIDDQAHVRAAIVVALRTNGFEVVAVADGTSGLNHFAASQFDLAIVDIYMPSFDGVQLMKELRKLSPSLPIIAISGVRLSDSQRTALDFLPGLPSLSKIVCLEKPFRSEQLLNAIRAATSVAA